MLLPVHAITQVRLEHRQLRFTPRLSRLPALPWYMLVGGATGAIVAIKALISSDGQADWDDSDLEFGDLLFSAGLGAAAGTLVYPLWKIGHPWYAEHATVYAIDPQIGYRIEVNTRQDR